MTISSSTETDTGTTARGPGDGPHSRAWHGFDVSQVTRELDVAPDRGLTSGEASTRLNRFGPNALAEKKKETGWQAFLRQYRDLMQVILLTAAVVNVVVTGVWSTTVVLAALTVFNAVLGLRQESKAEASLATLSETMSNIARVRRDGEAVEVDAGDLVPGDVVLIEAGNLVPAGWAMRLGPSCDWVGGGDPTVTAKRPPADSPGDERSVEMSYNLKGRSFLKEIDFEPHEMRYFLDLSKALKTAKYSGTEGKKLAGKEIPLIFEKTSTRTLAGFEVAAYDQGAHVTYFAPSGSQIGHKESIADTARVLGRMYDAIEYRGRAQADVEALAEHAGVPVYNGLTDEWHPTQMLADYLTMHETSGKPYDQLSYAFVGDLRFNMGRSHTVMAALMGADIRLAGPGHYAPPEDVMKIANEIADRTGASITVTEDPEEAVKGVDFIHTDVWVSMGEPKEVWQSRVEELKAYQVNSDLIAGTGNSQTRFMHCLPAFHDTNTTIGSEIMELTGMPDGLEVTNDVFESDRSVVFQQAENRLHTIKALLVATLA